MVSVPSHTWQRYTFTNSMPTSPTSKIPLLFASLKTVPHTPPDARRHTEPADHHGVAGRCRSCVPHSHHSPLREPRDLQHRGSPATAGRCAVACRDDGRPTFGEEATRGGPARRALRSEGCAR